MSVTLSYAYDNEYRPAAPVIPITVEGYSDRKPITLHAFVDTGADATMLGQNILTAVGAEYEDSVLLRGTAGGVQRVDRYTARIRVRNVIIPAVSAVATAAGSEPLIGRDVLNQLVIMLNGPAEIVEISVR